MPRATRLVSDQSGIKGMEREVAQSQQATAGPEVLHLGGIQGLGGGGKHPTLMSQHPRGEDYCN